MDLPAPEFRLEGGRILRPTRAHVEAPPGLRYAAVRLGGFRPSEGPSPGPPAERCYSVSVTRRETGEPLASFALLLWPEWVAWIPRGGGREGDPLLPDLAGAWAYPGSHRPPDEVLLERAVLHVERRANGCLWLRGGPAYEDALYDGFDRALLEAFAEGPDPVSARGNAAGEPLRGPCVVCLEEGEGGGAPIFQTSRVCPRCDVALCVLCRARIRACPTCRVAYPERPAPPSRPVGLRIRTQPQPQPRVPVLVL